MNPFHIARLLLVACLLAGPLAAADKPQPPAKPPLELLDQLSKADLGKVSVPSADERKLLAAVWEQKAKNPTADAKLTDAELVDLMLFASGVEDADARKTCKKQLAELRERVAVKLKGKTDPKQRAELLFKTVHAVSLSNGYELHQSSLAAALDSGKFNCVSSSALVYLVGVRYDLDLRPMRIAGTPGNAGHAYLEWVNGKERVVLECTNDQGFDWEGKVARKEIVPDGPRQDRSKARETDAAGLVAMLYRNRLAAAQREQNPDYRGSARLGVAVSTLVPTDPAATGVLTNWGGGLCDEKKFAEAVRFHDLALAAAPNEPGVKQNASFAVDNWAKAAAAAGKWADAVRIYRDGLKKLPGDRVLSHNLAFTYDSWAGEKFDAKEWDEALRIYDAGLKECPTDGTLKHNRKVCEQEKKRAN